MPPDSTIHIGCPAWSIPEWKGNFLPANAQPRDFLRLYSRVFNTVEGNSTFYALPKLETAQRWNDEVEPGFEFCFKVPRDISHGGGLLENGPLLKQWFEFLEIFAQGDTLGSSFLQLHGSFGPSRMKELREFCEKWPSQFPLAVEVRHPLFFEEGDAEAELNCYLTEHQIDRVLFDSRALYHAPPDDPVEKVSQARKPNLPVRWFTTGKRPFLRFVGRNQIEKADPWLKLAAEEVGKWLGAGLRPYVYLHAPDDTFAPTLCDRFYRELQQVSPGLPKLDLTRAQGDQLDLFH